MGHRVQGYREAGLLEIATLTVVDKATYIADSLIGDLLIDL
jgi:hypothetical protein